MLLLIIFCVSVIIFIVTIVLAVQCFTHYDKNNENQNQMENIGKTLEDLRTKIDRINTNSNGNANISASVNALKVSHDQLIEWLNNSLVPAINHITEINDKLKRDDLSAAFQKLLTDLRQKESCCLKEKLSSQGVPSDFQDSLVDIYQFIVALEKDFLPAVPSLQYSIVGQALSQKDWKNILTQVRGNIDKIFLTADQVKNLEREKKNLEDILNNQREEIKTLQSDKEQAQKDIEALNESIASQKEERESQERILRTQYETQIKQEQENSDQKLQQEQERCKNLIAATKNSFATFAPESILALFNVSLENMDKAGKRLMAVYSYLSLLRELRGSSFVKRFASFDRDLYIAFQGDELLQIRKKIEENLNPQILSEGYKIMWSNPGEKINPDIHYDDTSLGQVIAKVKSAVVYRLDDNGNWKCDSIGTVETR